SVHVATDEHRTRSERRAAGDEVRPPVRVVVPEEVVVAANDEIGAAIAVNVTDVEAFGDLPERIRGDVVPHEGERRGRGQRSDLRGLRGGCWPTRKKPPVSLQRCGSDSRNEYESHRHPSHNLSAISQCRPLPSSCASDNSYSERCGEAGVQGPFHRCEFLRGAVGEAVSTTGR